MNLCVMEIGLFVCFAVSLCTFSNANGKSDSSEGFVPKGKQYIKTGDGVFTEYALASALIDTVFPQIKNQHKERHFLRASEKTSKKECFATTDEGSKCCETTQPGLTYCLTVWCDASSLNCTCQLELNDKICEVCALCDAGDAIDFDCENIPLHLGSTPLASSNISRNAGETNTDIFERSFGLNDRRELENGCSWTDPGSYNICIDAVRTGTYTMDWTKAAVNAKRKWENVIVGDLPAWDIRISYYPSQYICNNLPEAVDDLYICFKESIVDGVGGVLGMAFPVFGRPGNSLPISGFMMFDSADIQGMINNGSLENVFAHEMGHVIGFGALLEARGLVVNDGTEKKPSYVYKGTKACKMWQKITGCGGCPPIENEYGPGTAGGHWDEDVLDDELMTGFAEWNGVPMPLSDITVGALEDLGYTVDYSKSDTFTQPAAPSCNRQGRRLDGAVRYLGKSKDGKPRKDRHGKKHRKKLSDVGRAKAMKYGKQVLVESRANRPKNMPEEMVYMADQFASVIIEEDGNYYSVEMLQDV